MAIIYYFDNQLVNSLSYQSVFTALSPSLSLSFSLSLCLSLSHTHLFLYLASFSFVIYNDHMVENKPLFGKKKNKFSVILWYATNLN